MGGREEGREKGRQDGDDEKVMRAEPVKGEEVERSQPLTFSVFWASEAENPPTTGRTE